MVDAVLHEPAALTGDEWLEGRFVCREEREMVVRKGSVGCGVGEDGREFGPVT